MDKKQGRAKNTQSAKIQKILRKIKDQGQNGCELARPTLGKVEEKTILVEKNKGNKNRNDDKTGTVLRRSEDKDKRGCELAQTRVG